MTKHLMLCVLRVWIPSLWMSVLYSRIQQISLTPLFSWCYQLFKTAAGHIAVYGHVFPQRTFNYVLASISLGSNHFTYWSLMSYRVVSNVSRFTMYSNHFMSCSLLTEGFKVFPFFSDDPSLQLNQALKYWICAV